MNKSESKLLKMWLPDKGQTILDAEIFEAQYYDAFVDQTVNVQCAVESYAQWRYKNGKPFRGQVWVSVADMNDKRLGDVLVETILEPTFNALNFAHPPL